MEHRRTFILTPWDESKIEKVMRLWNQELGQQFPMSEELLRQNSFQDQNVLPAGSAIAIEPESGRVVGFVVAKLWQEPGEVSFGKGIGWIQVLLVHRDYRGCGIGSALLQKAEEAFRKQGAQTILAGRDPWHYFPGIPDEYEDVKQWFAAKGYVYDGVIEHDLLCEYPEDEQVFVPDVPEVTFRLLEQGEAEQLLAFLHRCFPGRWEYEAISYFSRGGDGREFVVAVKDGTIIGFCRINDQSSPLIAQNVYWSGHFADGLGGIGPLGIDSAMRGSGYGQAIVEAGIAHLRERGLTRIVIDWTTLVSFYSKMGYKVWKRYVKYSKQLSPKQEV